MAYLPGFGLGNFRVFKEYTWFDFAPITILVGPNSSGKSSLIKALLLLKDNIKDAKGPLSTELGFYGTAHKLGSPNVVLYNKNNNDTFSYVLPIYTDFDAPYSSLRSHLSLFHESVRFTESVYRKFDFAVVGNRAINNYQENLVLADLTPIYTRKDFGKVYLNLPLLLSLVAHPINNEKDTFDKGRKQIISAIYAITNFLKQVSIFPDTSSYEAVLGKFIEINLWDRYQVDEFQELFILGSEEDYDVDVSLRIGQVEYEGNKYQLPGDVGYTFSEAKSIRDYLETLFPDNDQTKEVAEAICFLLRYKVAKNSRFYTEIKDFGFNINWIDWPKLQYIPPVKGEQRRSFRIDDNNSFNILINNIKSNTSTTEECSNFLTRWAERFSLGEIQIKSIDELNINYVEVKGRSLADVGYGYTQLTTLLMTIIAGGKYKDNPLEAKIKDSISMLRTDSHPVILLEEPETNLHPKFQSQLADLINEGRQFIDQFIIETHSEYFIRKFQYLVAKGEMKSDDIIIYYFHEPDNVPAGEKQVKKINVLKDGSLSDDFGPGFYDEAAHWELELLKLKRNKARQN